VRPENEYQNRTRIFGINTDKNLEIRGIRVDPCPKKVLFYPYGQCNKNGNPETDIMNKATQAHRRLLDFYGEPTWRNPLPALDELVSTILSQNTNDVNRDRAFDSLRACFPSWEEVREAPEEEVIEAIRTAGLANQKGPRIQNVLRAITEERGSLDLSFLEDFSADEAMEWLLKFKGVGPKTATIVLQFSLGKPAFPVDTHVHRISGRLGLRPEKMNADKAHAHLAAQFPPETYYAAHLNIIRLGREICNARKPKCELCPLTDLCDYFQQGRQS
jgi:endonuclease-3